MRSLFTILGKALTGTVVLALIGFALVLLFSWRGSRIPRRPANITRDGAFLERGARPFKFSTHGDWADCWEDSDTKSVQCKVTDESGVVKFEDFFVPYDANSNVKPKDLRIDAQKTRVLITDPPIIFLTNGQILLSKGQFTRAKELADTWARPSGSN